MRLIIGVTIFGLLIGPANAIDVSSQAEANTSANKLWTAVGGFCGISKRHPAIAKCLLAKSGQSRMRTLTTGAGDKLMEKLIKLDNRKSILTYQIIASPLPVTNYQSTMSVVPDNGGSKITWTGHFDAKGARDAEAQKVIQTIYDAGLQNLVKPVQKK